MADALSKVTDVNTAEQANAYLKRLANNADDLAERARAATKPNPEQADAFLQK